MVDNPFSLRVLPLKQVIPHEQVDPERTARLIGRLNADMKLKNPPIVTQWGEYFVVLDGATRVSALKEMGFQYVVAQVAAHQDGAITLQAWNHVKQNVAPERLLQSVEARPEINLMPVDAELVQAGDATQNELCYLVMANKKTFVIEAEAGYNRLDALNKLVDFYMEGGNISRTTEADFDLVKQKFPEMSGLFVFPSLTIDQVLQIPETGRVLPAGITRFIIPGRVLRINVDLQRLQKDEPIAAKSRWLNDILHSLVTNYRVRYYEEPVYLLDE